MSIKATSVPTKTLASSITSAATSFTLSNILGWNGSALTAADFGDQAYCVFRNAARTQIELMEFDPATIASTNITILRRGLKFDGTLTTEVSGNKLSWTKGDTFVDLGTDTPQLFQWLKEYVDTAIVSGAVPATTSVLGIARLSTAPVDALLPVVVGNNDTRMFSTTDKARTNATKTMVAGATINGATLPVPVYQNKTDNEFYACDANDTNALKFLGFAVSNSTNGVAIEVQFSGIVSGFTGLLEGEKYYVQDTVGTIGTTIGTTEVLVGIAISETELLIQKGRRQTIATGSVSDSGGSGATQDLVVTCGFRASFVRVDLLESLTASSPDAHAQGVFIWANGSGSQIQNPNGALEWNASLFAVTDTSFTVRFTQNAITPEGANYAVYAFGEI